MRTSPTPGQCAAIALLTSLALMAISPSLPATALAGIVGWVGAFAGDRFKDWLKDLLNSRIKKAPPDAATVFRNHHIRDLLQRALICTVEKCIPLAKEQFGDVPSAFHQAGKILAERLSEQTDNPTGALASFQDFNITVLLNDFVKNEGKIQVLDPATWAAFIDETPGLSDFKDVSDEQRRKQREALIQGLHNHFGEALWGIVKLDATDNKAGHAAVELLYLTRILEAVEKDKSATAAAVDIAPLTQRVAELLPQVEETLRPWFEGIHDGMRKLQQGQDEHRAETKQGIASLKEDTSATNRMMADVHEMMKIYIKGGSERKLADDYQTALRIVAAKHHLEPDYVRNLMIEDAERVIGDPNISLQDKVKALREAGKFVEARDFALEATARLERERQKAIRDEVTMLLEAAQLDIQLGHYEQARLHATKAESITDRQQDFVLWAEARHQHGRALRHLRRDQESYDLFSELVALRSEHLTGEHPDTLASRNSLASAMRDLHMPVEAEKEHRDVLTLRQRVLGETHSDTLASRNNLAILLQDQGKHDKAEIQHRALLPIMKKVLGEEHPHTLVSHYNLAVTLKDRGNHDEAELEFRTVLPIMRKVLGEEHPSTVDCQQELALALSAQNEFSKAEVEFRAVLTSRENAQGLTHPETLRTRNFLAIVLAAQGKLPDAEESFRIVLTTRQKLLAPEHSNVLESGFNLAMCLEDRDKLPEALEFMQHAEAGYRKVLGPEHQNTKDAREALERIQQKLRDQQK